MRPDDAGHVRAMTRTETLIAFALVALATTLATSLPGQPSPGWGRWSGGESGAHWVKGAPTAKP